MQVNIRFFARKKQLHTGFYLLKQWCCAKKRATCSYNKRARNELTTMLCGRQCCHWPYRMALAFTHKHHSPAPCPAYLSLPPSPPLLLYSVHLDASCHSQHVQRNAHDGNPSLCPHFGTLRLHPTSNFNSHPSTRSYSRPTCPRYV